jgi:hypothetical protein
MQKRTDKQLLFERMHKVAGMSINEQMGMDSLSIGVDAGILANMFNKIVEVADYTLLKFAIEMVSDLDDNVRQNLESRLNPTTVEAMQQYSKSM